MYIIGFDKIYNPIAEGKEIIKRLVESSDIVIANLPESTLASMGLDYESLRNINVTKVTVVKSSFYVIFASSNKI